MRTIKTTLLATIAFLLFFGLRTASAQPSPQQVVQQGSEKIRAILVNKVKKNSAAEKKQRQKLKRIVDGFLDYSKLAQLALGPHYKARTQAEFKEFTSILKDLIEASYTSSIRNNVNYTLTIEEEEISAEGDKADVSAVASAKNSKNKTVSEDLLFHLYLKGNQWMIYDIEFGDLSLVLHYRGEFNRKIKKESYQALIQTMKKKLAEVRSGKLENKLDF